MSRFIRDLDDGGSDEITVVEMFQMAEFCQVFLTARYIKDGTDNEFIPLIERGKLDRMPKEVAEELDEMFKLAITELEKWGHNPKGFFEMLEKGKEDPISEFIDSPEMRNALGNVIMRKLRISRGLHDDDEAFEEAKKLLPTVRDRMHHLVLGNVLQAMSALAEEVEKRNLSFENLSELVDAKVAMVDDQSIGFAARIKPEAERLVEKKQQEEKDKVKFDPAWG
jgi:hypothetical protein